MKTKLEMKHKISVIDDEVDILESYVSLLDSEFKVFSYQDPRIFIESLKNPENIPDLVITDFKMAPMNGLEMIQKANKSNYSFPFILLSGFLDKETVMKAVEVGVYRLLEKPSDYTVLRAAIDQLLVEYDIIKVREEIRDLISQLREFYTGIRLIMDQHIPVETMRRMLMDGPTGNAKTKMDFNSLLEGLETRLERLLTNEQMLVAVRANKSKA